MIDLAKIIRRSIAGDDDIARSFPTARSAIATWAQWRDDGVSLKSTSDPARFDAVPGGRRRLFDGREHLLEVERAIDAACRSHWRGEQVARVALEVFVTGKLIKRAVGLPEHKRKGRIAVREACTQGEVDGVCEALCVTEKALRRCSRELVAEVGYVLEVKQIVRAQRVRKGEEMASPINVARGFDLEGAKQIMAELGVGKWKFEELRKMGLPVRYSLVGGLVASKRELLEWLAANDAKATG